jgi:lipoprotein-anchoring transpeptidase ErfK/SrfK
MDLHPFASLRHGVTLVAIAFLAGGCGIGGPTPDHGADPARKADAAPAKDPLATHIVLRLGERRLYLMQGEPGTPIASYPVAVGKAGWETPTGRYQVEEMVENPDFLKVDDTVVPMRVIKRIPPGPTNPLGQRWIGFARGEGWTLGFHGTPNPELLGQAVSHGCVRMRNEDVVKLYGLIQVGTAVVVEP